MDAHYQPSAALLAANEKLKKLRAENPRGWGDAVPPWDVVDDSQEKMEALPAHLGFGSERLSQHFRDIEARKVREQRELGPRWWEEEERGGGTAVKQERPKERQELSVNDKVRVYPSLATGMLKREMTACGRVWLLLKYVDGKGSGRVSKGVARLFLTGKESPFKVVCWRRLRQILHAGQGVFWDWDGERVWLYGVTKVALALDVEVLRGRPVLVPVAGLLGNIGAFKAHLYATFHSGRANCDGEANPIARETLAVVCGVSASTQRNYEERVGVVVQQNFAVGDRSTEENKEEAAWEHGNALFELFDLKGYQGEKGGTYHAWQLPNRYIAIHDHANRGRQKRANRELKDLFMQGITGNSNERFDKVYFGDGGAAAKVCSRDERDVAWWRGQTRSRRFGMWQEMKAVV